MKAFLSDHKEEEEEEEEGYYRVDSLNIILGFLEAGCRSNNAPLKQQVSGGRGDHGGPEAEESRPDLCTALNLHRGDPWQQQLKDRVA